jgi:Phage Tail Collar Domain
MRLHIPHIPHIPHLRTVAEIVGAAVLLSGGAASAAALMPAATSTTVNACENTKSGALSVRLHATCPAGTRAISWNTTGPRGPAGPSGTTGIFGTKTNTAAAGTAGAQCTVGQVVLTAGSTAPTGTVPANGQLLQISTNAVLYALFGTRYGGNGKTTFGVPNLKKAAPNGLSYSICEYNSVYP